MRLALIENSDRPLYDQIGQVIRCRIVSGTYTPGVALPGEVMLAAELRVSQGTVRKALDGLVNERILFRRQGLGTFVSEPSKQRLNCLFFNFNHNGGGRVQPVSRQLFLRTGAADKLEREKLGLRPGEKVLRSRRLRFSAGAPIIVEYLSIPCAMFPRLALLPELPESLYPYLQAEYNLSITCVREEVAAIPAPVADAQLLGVAVGTPLLFVDRVALADERLVEWRRISCLSHAVHMALERA